MLLIEKYPETIEQFVEDLNPNISLTELGIGSTKNYSRNVIKMKPIYGSQVSNKEQVKKKIKVMFYV